MEVTSELRLIVAVSVDAAIKIDRGGGGGEGGGEICYRCYCVKPLFVV